MRLLDDATVRSFLASVERGDTLLVCLGQTPDDVWAGDVTYAASGEYDGWCIVVFNDCNDFDYVDCVESPDGARMEFPNWPEPDNVLANYRANREVAERCYHFPKED